MLRMAVIICLICFSTLVRAQSGENANVRNRILNIPKQLTVSPDSIAAYIQTAFRDEKEKFEAIYRWVTYNIRYNTDSMYVLNRGTDPGPKSEAALRRRKAVCEGYTALFNNIASKCGLESYIVSGYTKQSGFIDKSGHSWCLVNIKDEWLFCDPTWDEGYTSSTRYFLISPTLFIETHMPFDPIWQLLDVPVSDADFYRGNFSAQSGGAHAAAVLREFLKLDTLRQLEAASNRVREKQKLNNLTKNQVLYMQMQIAIIHEEKSRNLYNAAVEELNNANAGFNKFIEFRNNRFLPERTEIETMTELKRVNAFLSAAENKIIELDRLPGNEQYNPESLTAAIKALSGKLEEQKGFLTRYFSLKAEEREKLFYE